MEGIRRRAEFIAGIPLVAAQYAAQRASDTLKDASVLVRREQRNARFIGELTVRALVARRRRTPDRKAPVHEASTGVEASPRPVPTPVVGDLRHAHLGVAELLAAIPAMSPSERSDLLAEERAGRRRSRVIELLEHLGA